MNTNEFRGPLLSFLDNRELSAITFVRNYVQLHFDGPCINAYVWPIIKVQDKFYRKETCGYRDALCAQIGAVVTTAIEQPNDKLAIFFADGVVFEISLKEEDRSSVEAAMFQDGTGKLWNVW